MSKAITIGVIVTLLVLGYTALTQAQQKESDAHRGCVASAYQAERYGHNLEENLEACKGL